MHSAPLLLLLGALLQAQDIPNPQGPMPSVEKRSKLRSMPIRSSPPSGQPVGLSFQPDASSGHPPAPALTPVPVPPPALSPPFRSAAPINFVGAPAEDAGSNVIKEFRTRKAPACTLDPEGQPCEGDSDYDEGVRRRVEQLLSDTRLNSIIQDATFSQLLNDSLVSREKGGGLETRTRTELGSGFLVTENAACSARESIIYPKRAKTTQDDWVFVLNQEGVKQGVRVEKCINEGGRCSEDLGDFPGVRTVCRQKYIYRKVLVLSSSGTNIQPESILIPSCCVCYISRVDDPHRISGRQGGVDLRP